MELIVVAGLAITGVLLWRRLAPGLQPLPPGESVREGVLYALFGLVATDLLTTALAELSGLPDPTPLERLLPLRAISGLVVAAVVLAIAARRGGVRTLGLRRTAGSSPPILVGIAAWMAYLPVVLLVSWLNLALLSAFGKEQPPQHWIEAFLDSPAAQGSPATWLAIVLVLPFGEELWFRGGLYGALRRVLSVPLAVAVSAALFGFVHDPAYMLPAAALGVALTLLYERTGSLVAPLTFHVLHNGVTLAMVRANLDWRL
jgi:membrane protease YdiL (CAAX protease family)